MNVREASNRLIVLYARRWLFAVAVGVPGLLIAGTLQKHPRDPIWMYVRSVFEIVVVVTLAVALAWVVSGLFERRSS